MELGLKICTSFKFVKTGVFQNLFVCNCMLIFLFVLKKMFSCGTLLNSQIKIGVDSLTEKFSPDFDLKAELEKGLVPSPPGSPTRKKAHR